MSYLSYIAWKIRHAAEIKWLAGLFVSISSFLFDPTQYVAMGAVFFLCLTDFFFGVAASRHGGEPIRSSKVVRTAIKIAVYFSLIAAARAAEHAIPFTFLDTTVIGFLAATELLSILENTGRLGFAVPRKIVDLLGDYVSAKGDENARRTIEHHKHKHTK